MIRNQSAPIKDISSLIQIDKKRQRGNDQQDESNNQESLKRQKLGDEEDRNALLEA